MTHGLSSIAAALAGATGSGVAEHAVCGTCALVFVVAAFAVQYAALVAASHGLGVLSSTAIVWLFIAAWLALWLLLDLVVAVARPGAESRDRAGERA